MRSSFGKDSRGKLTLQKDSVEKMKIIMVKLNNNEHNNYNDNSDKKNNDSKKSFAGVARARASLMAASHLAPPRGRSLVLPAAVGLWDSRSVPPPCPLPRAQPTAGKQGTLSQPGRFPHCLTLPRASVWKATPRGSLPGRPGGEGAGRALCEETH